MAWEDGFRIGRLRFFLGCGPGFRCVARGSCTLEAGRVVPAGQFGVEVLESGHNIPLFEASTWTLGVLL
jgi:hypothetical protein